MTVPVAQLEMLAHFRVHCLVNVPDQGPHLLRNESPLPWPLPQGEGDNKLSPPQAAGIVIIGVGQFYGRKLR